MVTKFLQSFIAVRQRRPDTICSRAPGRGAMKEKSFGTDLSSLRLSEDVVTRQQPRDNPCCYIITTSHHSQQCVLMRPHLRLALAPVSRPNWWPDSGSSADLLHHKRWSLGGFIVCCQNDSVSCNIINHRNKHINFAEKDKKRDYFSSQHRRL